MNFTETQRTKENFNIRVDSFCYCVFVVLKQIICGLPVWNEPNSLSNKRTCQIRFRILAQEVSGRNDIRVLYLIKTIQMRRCGATEVEKLRAAAGIHLLSTNEIDGYIHERNVNDCETRTENDRETHSVRF